MYAHLGAKRLPACEPCHSGSGRRGSALLSRDPLFFQGHAANRFGQEKQSGIPGAWGREATVFRSDKSCLWQYNLDFTTIEPAYSHPFFSLYKIYKWNKQKVSIFLSQVGLHKFLPRSVLNGMKPKALRKLIQQHFKKVAALSELECMFKFFDLLRAHYRFDQERFICALGVSNSTWKFNVYVSDKNEAIFER